MVNPTRAFTTSFDGLSNVLRGEVKIGLAFDADKSPAPPLYPFVAIWDTGATASVITNRVVQKCGLKPTGMTRVITAKSVDMSYTYLASIGLPNGVGFSDMRVTEGSFGDADVLIGMDIIARGDFVVTNFEGKTVFFLSNSVSCQDRLCRMVN